jgi:hypothetical protein
MFWGIKVLHTTLIIRISKGTSHLSRRRHIHLSQGEGRGCSPDDFTYNTIIQGLLQHNETSWVMNYL